MLVEFISSLHGGSLEFVLRNFNRKARNNSSPSNVPLTPQPQALETFRRLIAVNPHELSSRSWVLNGRFYPKFRQWTLKNEITNFTDVNPFLRVVKWQQLLIVVSKRRLFNARPWDNETYSYITIVSKKGTVTGSLSKSKVIMTIFTNCVLSYEGSTC